MVRGDCTGAQLVSAGFDLQMGTQFAPELKVELFLTKGEKTWEK